jgi:hypothetical protein
MYFGAAPRNPGLASDVLAADYGIDRAEFDQRILPMIDKDASYPAVCD